MKIIFKCYIVERGSFMAKSFEPILKKCRVYGIEPAVLGYNKKPSIRHKQNNRNKKMSEYGLQLREKQKAKFVYGVLERQFRLTYRRASKMHGSVGKNLLILLEMRLDNVVFRAKISRTRNEAKQVVRHGHILVNGRKVDIPSYIVKVGDVISVSDKSKQKGSIQEAATYTAAMSAPPWLQIDKENYIAEVIAIPQREDLDFEIDERFIVELYSR